MAIAYFMFRAARAIKDIGSAELYEGYQVVRDLYSDVSTWTGLTVPDLLDEDVSEKVENLHSVLAIRSLANHLSLADILAEEGLKPSAVIGLSLGLISGSCLSGALGRRDAFEMLWERRHIYDAPASVAGQAVAMCRIGPDDDPDRLCGESWPGVYPAAYFGVTPDGESQYLLLAGYTEALDRLAASEPDAVLKVISETRAAHTPLRQHECDFVRSYLADVCFADPVIPLIGCMDPGALRTALDVRAALCQNHVRPVRASYAMAELAARGIELCIALGPTQVENLMRFPCPVIRIEKPADVASALAAVAELGI
jgi:[acyl-carrier-protein] S-malonyltransferase